VGIGPDWETADEVLFLAVAHGFKRSRDQLRHFHQNGVVPKPQVRNRRIGQGRETMYPPSTGAQYVRALELKRSTKLLDRIKWELWCEGYTVELSWIRPLIADTCRGFDLGIARAIWQNGRPTEEFEAYLDDASEARLSSRAARHARKRVTTNAFPLLVEAAVLTMAGRPPTDDRSAELVARGLGHDTAIDVSFLGGGPLVPESATEDIHYISRFFQGESLEGAIGRVGDDDLVMARRMMRAVLSIASRLSPDVECMYGRWAGGLAFHPAYVSDLKSMWELQTLLVALLAVNLGDTGLREAGTIAIADPDRPLDPEHQRWVVLNRLAEAVPDFECALEPKRYAKAVSRPDLMQTINEELRIIYLDNREAAQEFARRYKEETGIEVRFSPDEALT
jgi:hypothetical protein